MTAGASLSNLASNFYKEGSETMYFLLIGGSTFLVGFIILLVSKKLAKEMAEAEGDLDVRASLAKAAEE